MTAYDEINTQDRAELNALNRRLLDLNLKLVFDRDTVSSLNHRRIAEVKPKVPVAEVLREGSPWRAILERRGIAVCRLDFGTGCWQMEHYSANYAINRFKWQSYVRHHEIGLWFDLTEKGLAAAKAWAEERLAEVAQAKAARDTAKPHYNWRQWRYWFRPASPKPVQSKPVRSYPVPPTLEQIKARFTLVGTVDLGEDQQWEVI